MSTIDFAEEEEDLNIEGEDEAREKLRQEKEEAAEKERQDAIERAKVDEAATQDVVDEEEIAEALEARPFADKYFPYRRNNFMKWSGLDFYFMVLIGPYGRIRVLGAVLGVIVLTTYAIYGYICYKLCNCLCGGKREHDDDEKKNQ